MEKLRPHLSFLLIFAVPLISVSCGSATSPRLGLNIVASISQQTAGSITFRIGVENTGLTTKTLIFGDSQFFDIEVKDQSGRLVWQWSYGLSFPQSGWSLELLRGESSVQDIVWNLTGNDQKPLPSGLYTAKMYITSLPRDEGLSTVISLTI